MKDTGKSTIRKLQLRDYISEGKLFYKSSDYALNERSPLHSHDFYEIHLVTKGRFLHNLNGVEKILETGHIQIINPLDVHDLEGISKGRNTLVNFAFSKESFSDQVTKLDMKGCSHFPLIHLEAYQLKMQSFRLSLLETRTITIPQCSLALLMDYLCIAKTMPLNQEASISLVPYWLKKVLNTMEDIDNLNQGPSRFVELSERSHEHVSRVMKSCFDLTITDWVNSHRMDIARNLVLSSNMPILDIAYEVGFESESYFYRLYKKQFATTPNKERKTSHITTY